MIGGTDTVADAETDDVSRGIDSDDGAGTGGANDGANTDDDAGTGGANGGACGGCRFFERPNKLASCMVVLTAPEETSLLRE